MNTKINFDFSAVIANKNYHKILLLLMTFTYFLWAASPALAAEVTVSTPAEFKQAWANKATTKIILKKDIIFSGTAGLANRTTDIEITGEEGPGDYGYQLILANGSLRVDNPTTATGKATIKLHDIIVQNNGAVTGARGGFVEDDSYTGDSARNWTLEVGNINVPKGSTMRMARFTRGQINVYGNNYVSTLGENVYTGGMSFAEGTQYYGEITRQNYSTIWFRSSIQAGDSGDGKFNIGDNASVKLRNTGTGTTYPAVYRAFKEIIVGENAQFTATVPGAAVQFGGTNKKFTAKKGSTSVFTSLGSYPSISTNSVAGGDSAISAEDRPRDAVNAQMSFEPGSSLFVIGNTSRARDGMIDWTTGSNNSLKIDTPKQFEIRNNSKYRALNVAGKNSIEILNSNLDMWKLNSVITNNADFSHNNVERFGVSGANVGQSSEALLQNEYNGVGGQVRRIIGLNTEPTIEWGSQLTDADKSMNKMARVILGMIPDDTGLDVNGDLHYIPLYASKGQAKVKLTDSLATYPEKEIITEDAGYISNPVADFYKAGTVLNATAIRSGLIGSVFDSLPLVDVTPPQPAKLDLDKVTTSSKKIVGKDGEAGAKVYLYVNGTKLGGETIVAEDGSWSYELQDFLKANDTVSIYLEDNAGKAPADLNPGAPATNNILGNINPEKELAYRDAIFLPATVIKVEDDVASQPLITKTVKSNTLDAANKEITQVGSILTYEISIKNNDPLNSGKVIAESKFEDLIPTGLVFNLKDLTATLNGQEISNTLFKYEESKLSLAIGDFAPQDTLVIKYPTTVTRGAVDEEISNLAKISGLTTQGKPVENEASVKNPGGPIAGLLAIESAPANINFGTHSIRDYKKRVGVDQSNLDLPLVIEDTRKSRGAWELTAQVVKEMTNDGDELVGALQYYRNGVPIVLTSTAKPIYGKDGKDEDLTYNVSQNWSKDATAEGLKLEVQNGKIPKITGSYVGEIKWSLRETIE